MRQTTTEANEPTAPTSAADAPGAATRLFLRSLELAAVELYRTAADTGLLGSDAAALLRECVRHHVDHANALGTAPRGPNVRWFEELNGRLAAATDQRTALEVCRGAEETLAATYLSVATGDPLTGLAASILPTESAHAVAIGLAIGTDEDDLFGDGGRQTDTGALAAGEYPPS